MKNYIPYFGKLSIYILTFTLIIPAGCKKEVLPDRSNIAQISGNKKLISPMGNGVPSYPLDWENISYMPAPPNTNPIPVPWQSGLGGRKIDDDIVFDYKKSDGWELVYNTFNTSAVLNPAYFMLYNKYRGLLRTYFYFTTPSSYPSSNLAYLLNLRGSAAAGSPLLNFSGGDVVDVAINNFNVSQIQPYMVSGTGAWYASEFEIAYDRNINAVNYQNLQLNWSINPNSISQITLNGKETGTISGTVEQKKEGTNFFTGITNNLLDGGLKIGSKKAADNLGFIKSQFIKDNILNAVNLASNGIGGFVKGFLSGIIGGGSSTPTTQQVNLKINSTIEITGQSVVQSQLFDNIFTLPGTLDNQSSVPFYPNYNSPMGVFYISAKPVVKIKRTLYNINHPANIQGARTNFQFSLDESSYQLIFNPALLAEATISNVQKEIILTKAYYGEDIDRESSSLGEENVAGVDMFSHLESLTLTGPRLTLALSSNLVLRVTFDVIPNNGSGKVTIVKTFKATGQQI